MTKQVVPGTRRKSYEEQQAMINASGKGYQLPTLMAAATLALSMYVSKGTRLLKASHTRCESDFAVGGFSEKGLTVSKASSFGDNSLELGACACLFL
jgi:hypothetical protein